MFTLGHVTDNDEAIKLYENYNIPYKVVKSKAGGNAKAGGNVELGGNFEVRAKMSSNSYEFTKAIDTMLRRIGADWMLDHIDVCQTEDGELIFIASPYADRVVEEIEKLSDKARRRGYEIVDSGFKPYAHEHAIVVRRI